MSHSAQPYGNLKFEDYKILVIDDNPTNLSVAVDYLEDCGFTILVSQNGESGLKRATYACPHIILLDVLMPGLDGFETCKLLKQNHITKDIPVIFMTALSDTENKIKGFTVGAVDYVTKPIQVEEVLARITVHLKLQSLTLQLEQQAHQLEQQNLTLEQRVQERTTQLTHSLHDLRQAKHQLERSFEEVINAKDEAELAGRARSQLFARMSHEFRTPLNAIIGFSELLQLQLSDNNTVMPDWLQNTQLIYQAGNQLLALVDDILALSGVELSQSEADFVEFNIFRLIEEICIEVKPLADNNNNVIGIRVCPDGSDPCITLGMMYADRSKVYRILLNVVQNACKFTQNGSIVLTATRQQNSIPPHIIIQVTDTGVGVSPHQLDRIFEPFTQADESDARQYPGAGLGLAIAQKFCRFLGGEITVTSALNQGSTFTIHLPVEANQNDTTQR